MAESEWSVCDLLKTAAIKLELAPDHRLGEREISSLIYKHYQVTCISGAHDQIRVTLKSLKIIYYC